MLARFKGRKIPLIASLAIIACMMLIAGASCTGGTSVIGESQMSKFSSFSELERVLEARRQGGDDWILDWNLPFTWRFNAMSEADSTSESGEKGTSGYSETNVQVAGVDEADIVKTDGQYIYYVVSKYVYIVGAYPADGAEVVAVIELEGSPIDIFINGDNLLIYESGANYYYYDAYYYPSNWDVDINIYDITDRANPVLSKEVSTGGNYISSRMVGNYVYTVINKHAYNSEGQVELPEISVDGDIISVPATDIYYPDTYDRGYGFTTILAININDNDVVPSHSTMLLGSAGVVYMSPSNIYVSIQSYMPRNEVTQIHRFAVNEGIVSYQAVGEVPGYLLNQFSMDEHNGYFRVATTTSGFVGEEVGVGTSSTSTETEDRIEPSPVAPGEWTTNNNVYVLNLNLEVVGKVENLAPGERIYSARFMGDRGYMVTFRQVDPLFAIDLSDPTDPQVLGELKITGYSDYLHPYDENHLIGIGKEATEQGLFQGMKIALFDVSDISNPVQIDVYEIGDRGTESPVLRDHKAFLFDKELNMMVMPVLVAEIEEANTNEWQWGEYVWQGAYVFDISPEEGINLRGSITHYDDGFDADNYWYYGNMLNDVKRSLYIDDVLYTISNGALKMNDLETLDHIGKVELWDGEGLDSHYMIERVLID